MRNRFHRSVTFIPEEFERETEHGDPNCISSSSLRNAPLSEIMRQTWPPQSKKGFWDLLPGENPPKFLFLKPNPPIEGIIAQVSFKDTFSLNFDQAYQSTGDQMLSCQ